MEEKILKELQEIKKVLQDIIGILEPKEIKIQMVSGNITADKMQNASNQLFKGEKTLNQIRVEFGLNPINYEITNKLVTRVQFDNNEELD